MRSMTAAAIAEAVAGRAVAAPGRAFTAVTTDTRRPAAGGLFVALRGARFDGHAFLAEALAAGAGGVLVSDQAAAAGLPADVAVVVVADTERALTALAAAVRAAHPGQVAAITGSAGKTTVKDMVAAALTGSGAVARTPGNWNNHLGLPLTLLGTTGDEAFLVLELGMSASGEIAALTALARPDVGLVTNAAAAHLAFFPSVDAIADAKAELYAALAPGAVAVANADDARMHARAIALHGQHLVTFGSVAAADVRLVGATLGAGGLTAELSVHGAPIRVQVAALGAHNALNAAAALALTTALGVDPRAAAASLGQHFSPSPHRLALARAAGGLTVLDDSYNANPASSRAALDTLGAVAPSGAVLGAVLGTMRELGPDAPALHRELGAYAARVGVTWLAATGEHAADLAEGARAAGLAHVITARDAAELEGPARRFAAAGHWLLLKGSRGERLERLLGALGAGPEVKG